MMNIIAYVLPAIVASQILIKLGFKERLITFVSSTSLFIILIFILNSCVLIWGFDYSSIIIDFSSIGMSFMVRYLLLSLLCVFTLPFLLWNINKNIQFRVKEKILIKENY